MTELPDPWFRPADKQAHAVRREALAEIGPDHELAGRRLAAMAVCGGCDHVAFRVDDGTFAMVHLTWTGKQEPRQWPRTRRIRSELALRQAMSDHSGDHH